ncbi:MAG: PqqD family protein [Bacteriovoracaceae bacterium]|nr:PqqD family protein [Bacteriovoracaceae bacterium]
MKTYIRRQVPFKVMDEICYIIDSFETKAAYKLNTTSTSLWLFLSEPRTFDEILSHFRSEFEDMTQADLEADVEEVIQEFIKMSLINEA